jgi:hypothetical protein
MSIEDGAAETYTVQVSSNMPASVADLASLLAGYAANTPSSPIPVKMNVNLANSANGLALILSAIDAAGKYVHLDFSGCPMTDTKFDPGSSAAGKAMLPALFRPARPSI